MHDDGKIYTRCDYQDLYTYPKLTYVYSHLNIGLKQPKITRQTTGEPGQEHITIVLSYGGISANTTNAL